MMQSSICEAIRNRRIVEFTYKAKRRTVEPHTLGADGNGTITLCGWQLSGGSGQSWRDFHLSSMSALVVLDELFEGPRPGYRRDDRTLSKIVCQL